MSQKKTSSSKHPDKALEEYTENSITPEDREEMISEAAYYRAEQHGFNPTSVDEDWFEAEKTIDAMLYKEAKETEEHY